MEHTDPISYIESLEQDSKDKQSKISELTNFTHSNIQSQDTNLIQWQLELDNILERIEHLLKGDLIKEDVDGNIVYTTPQDKTLIVFNDYGVQLIMNVISFYLNRNTILSHYKDERIFEIMFDLGEFLTDLIYINYEKMGLNTVEKKSRYPMLVMNILHMIESTYNRALGGNELDSLRSARVVTQSQPIGGGSQPQMQMQKKKHFGGFLNPRNHF